MAINRYFGSFPGAPAADVFSIAGLDTDIDIYYIDNAADMITAPLTGLDLIYTTINFTLPAGFAVEGITIISAAGLTVTGNELNNEINGGDGADTLNGGLGIDTLRGNGGDDRLFGGQDNDFLYGGAGNDRLYGEAGNDLMYGGAGNDVYYIAEAGDRVFEVAGEGADTVQSRVDYTLADGQSIETMIVQVSDGRTLTGNELAQGMYGNIGDDTLNGAGGNDDLFGGDGLDTLNGGDGDDRISGQNGDDTMSGGAGNDLLTGGAGADTFLLDKVQATAQTDRITDFSLADDKVALGDRGPSSWTALNNLGLRTGPLGAEISITWNGVEQVLRLGTVNLVALQAANETGPTPNFVFDTSGTSRSITGTANADDIFGGLGADTLNAGGGADYIFADAGDDIVNGDGGDDWLFGGAGNDTLNGGEGNDRLYDEYGDTYGEAGENTLVGGLGNDIYYVDSYHTTLVEVDGEGFDILQTSVDFSMAEGLSIEAVSAGRASYGVDLNGNSAANELSGSASSDDIDGNGGNDDLYGQGGNDYIRGGEGDDRMAGGADSDTFEFTGAWGDDLITDFNVAEDWLSFYGVEGLTSAMDIDITALGDGSFRLSYGDHSVRVIGNLGAGEADIANRIVVDSFGF